MYWNKVEELFDSVNVCLRCKQVNRDIEEERERERRAFLGFLFDTKVRKQGPFKCLLKVLTSIFKSTGPLFMFVK